MSEDPFDLARFRDAQRGVWDRVLGELAAGRKTSHWMWFIFPQIDGLGSSFMAQKYALSGLEEARAYLADTTLGPRLIAGVNAMLRQEHASAEAILGGIDAVKFRSCLTLFREASGQGLFQRALDRFYGGDPDPATLQLLNR